MNNKFIIGAVATLFFVLSINVASAQWTPDPFCPYPSDGITRYRYFGNCSIYWECFNGAKYIMQCPEGLEFNEDYQQCDAPEIANCDPNAPTTENPNPPTYTMTTDDGSTLTPWTHDPMCPYPSDVDIFFPYDGDCTKYWQCSDGTKIEKDCPDGLWWHQAISECDFPGDYCDDTTKPTDLPTSCLPNLSSQISSEIYPCLRCEIESNNFINFAASTSDGTTHGDVDPRCVDTDTDYFPHPVYCNMYIECFEGNSYEMTCPEDLFFSDNAKSCVEAVDSECCDSSSQC